MLRPFVLAISVASALLYSSIALAPVAVSSSAPTAGVAAGAAPALALASPVGEAVVAADGPAEGAGGYVAETSQLPDLVEVGGALPGPSAAQGWDSFAGRFQYASLSDFGGGGLMFGPGGYASPLGGGGGAGSSLGGGIAGIGGVGGSINASQLSGGGVPSPLGMVAGGGFFAPPSAAASAPAPVSAIPEPGTWALMILGFGIVGSALRSKRRPRGTALSAS